MMPLDLVLVRHGESEGNIANKRSRAGDDSAFTAEFLRRHSSSWRLTDKGIAQAKAAGEWIRKNFNPVFQRKYTSEYLRAMETAYWLELPGSIPWYVEFYLRERDQGAMDVVPDSERQTRFAKEMQRRAIDSFFWRPPRGESMAELCLRVDRVLDTLHRECSKMRVIIVCHGEVMWAFRVRLERMSQQRFRELDASEHPYDHIHNGQIIHYTRLNPLTHQEESKMNWMRSICPWDQNLSGNGWQEIVRPQYDQALLKKVFESVPRIVF
jgi:NAD+ kinase